MALGEVWERLTTEQKYDEEDEGEAERTLNLPILVGLILTKNGESN
jgi:hypothetical protein